MAYVKVDYSKFEHAASAIDTYISRHRSNMNNIDREITNLSATWQGKDYISLKNEWNEMKAHGSTSDKMIKSLKSYAEYLRMAAKKYKEAQSNAVNRANSLPRW